MKVYGEKIKERIKLLFSFYGPVYLMPPKPIYNWNSEYVCCGDCMEPCWDRLCKCDRERMAGK